MITAWRICHIRRNGIFEPADLGEVKAGDLFHLFEPYTDAPVKDRNGAIDQFAIGDAIPIDPEGNFSVVCLCE